MSTERRPECLHQSLPLISLIQVAICPASPTVYVFLPRNLPARTQISFAVSRRSPPRSLAPAVAVAGCGCGWILPILFVHLHLDFLLWLPGRTLIKNSVIPSAPLRTSQRHLDFSPATTATTATTASYNSKSNISHHTTPLGASIPIALLGSRKLCLYLGKLCLVLRKRKYVIRV